MNRCFIISLLILAALSNPLNAAETVYVSSKQAKIYKEANFSSDLIASLKQFDAIQLIEHKGIWMQINYSDIYGWMSQFSVTRIKPFEGDISITQRLINFFSGLNKRSRLTLVSTAGGVRGFSDDETDPSGKKDFNSVAKMESVKVSEVEVENFISSNTN